MKPPFSLADGCHAESLLQAVQAFCRERMPFELPPLTVTALDGFLALVPNRDCPDISDLAAACVEHFDGFRRPPDPAELARRRAAGLSPRQTELLAIWGYPYVMDQFRFHMTLTGRMTPDLRAKVEPVLADMFGDALDQPVRVEGLALYRQDDGGPFRLTRQVSFS